MGFKAFITSALGPFFGLTLPEAIRTGFLTAGGGEFAFVVFTLGQDLEVLPEELSRILVGVVVMSMALTPALGALGDFIADKVEALQPKQEGVIDVGEAPADTDLEGTPAIMEPIVICGYGDVGKVLYMYLTSEKVRKSAGGEGRVIVVEILPEQYQRAKDDGVKDVFLGDFTDEELFKSINVVNPRVIAITTGQQGYSLAAAKKLKPVFPDAPILTQARSEDFAMEMIGAGARVVRTQKYVSTRLGTELTNVLGFARNEMSAYRKSLLNDLSCIADSEEGKECIIQYDDDDDDDNDANDTTNAQKEKDKEAMEKEVAKEIDQIMSSAKK